ncbi:RHS repeat-associated core domain-containing protein [Pseudomonas sp. MWU13-2105]|uniref:RHS repeat-associated core domain-containing protein n=1 Tax=Pseudomonas sp. MWU13-2105 TaxID=2935074 RepID=UPI00298C453B|nr:RHS repeat-associated core domain-containing protein [Pseudomonas sp. MWU13-2105]
MSRLTGGLHTHTPTLAVIDPRGLAVRSVAYCRSVATAQAEERVNRSAYDAMGRLVEQWDPRLWALSAEDATTPANLINRYSLSEKVLNSLSVDAGERISLFGDGDQLVQTYHYDAGGNLLELVHVGPQSHSRKLTAARYSNRCLPGHNDRPPTEDEIAVAFDGNGNLLALQPGQAMSWDLRNQLREVRPVERESSDDDLELYFYGGDGLRRRKVRSTQTKARSLISEVRYLPGLEIRTRKGTGEVLQVICVQAGRSAMQVLHWETAPPSSIANDQYRYNLTDHLGSSSLELDSEAQVISQETYHPYGGTAWFAGRSEVEASYKTVRYSGKERDAAGLYYYGFRYYVPWLQRWNNPDPAGSMDGLNVYAFVQGDPVNGIDKNGLWGEDDRKLKYFRHSPPRAIPEGQDIYQYAAKRNETVAAHGLDNFVSPERAALADALYEAPLVLQEARWMLYNRSDLSTPVLRSFFGPEHTHKNTRPSSMHGGRQRGCCGSTIILGLVEGNL